MAGLLSVAGFFLAWEDSSRSFPPTGLLEGDPVWPAGFCTEATEDWEPKRPGEQESRRGSFRLRLVGNVVLSVAAGEGNGFRPLFFFGATTRFFISFSVTLMLASVLALNVYQSD